MKTYAIYQGLKKKELFRITIDLKCGYYTSENNKKLHITCETPQAMQTLLSELLNKYNIKYESSYFEGSELIFTLYDNHTVKITNEGYITIVKTTKGLILNECE